MTDYPVGKTCIPDSSLLLTMARVSDGAVDEPYRVGDGGPGDEGGIRGARGGVHQQEAGGSRPHPHYYILL